MSSYAGHIVLSQPAHQDGSQAVRRQASTPCIANIHLSYDYYIELCCYCGTADKGFYSSSKIFHGRP